MSWGFWMVGRIWTSIFRIVLLFRTASGHFFTLQFLKTFKRGTRCYYRRFSSWVFKWCFELVLWLVDRVIQSASTWKPFQPFFIDVASTFILWILLPFKNWNSMTKVSSSLTIWKLSDGQTAQENLKNEIFWLI